MNDQPLSAREEAIIDRLRNAPQATLEPESSARIQQQLFHEMEAMAASANATSSSISISSILKGVLALGGLVAIIVIITTVVNSPTTSDSNGSTAEYITATQTAPASEPPTNIPLNATQILESTPATTSTITLGTVTVTPSPSPLQDSTSESTPLPPLTVIEGKITALDDTTVTVFDMTIQVDADDPIWETLQVGDTVRVEGYTEFKGDMIIITAINLVVFEIDVISIDGEAVAPLPAGCKLTGFGNDRIHCKDSD